MAERGSGNSGAERTDTHAGPASAAGGAGAAVTSAEAVIMPRLDMTTEEMTILRWMKAEGEYVAEGDPLLEVMTEKIAIEIDAPIGGYVRDVRFGADDVVPVGEVIAFIAETADGPLGDAGGNGLSGGAAEGAHAAGAAEMPEASHVGSIAGVADPASAAATGGSGYDTSEIVRAAPIVRRIAADLGVDLRSVPGTGPGGRVLADDVRRAAARVEIAAKGPAGIESEAVRDPGGGKAATEAGPRRVGHDAEPVDAAGDAVELRLSPLRRTIARRMSDSWQGAPHVTLFMDVDMFEAAAFRGRLQEALLLEFGENAVSLTWNNLIAWAAVQALVRRPELNATLEDGVLRRYANVNLGVAVDAAAGLLVPVVRGAQRLGPGALARAIADVVEKAQRGRLEQADVRGGTFTITNLGAFGISGFAPIINPPQVAILGVGAVRDQVVPVNGEPAVRPMCTFSLSVDHRAADGADGARYLQELKKLLLHPHRLVV